jgi:hypothetical protein
VLSLLFFFVPPVAGCADSDLWTLTDVRRRAADVDPPRVVAISLGALGDEPQGVSLWPQIRATISEPLDPGTLDDDAVTLRTEEDPVEIAVSIEDLDVVARPLSRLAARTAHVLVLSATLRDLHGAPLSDEDGVAAPFEYAFVTGDSAAGPPIATLSEPAPGATGVPTNVARIVVRFNEAVGPGRISIAGGPAIDAAMFEEGLAASIAPADDLHASSRVELLLDGFLDADGEAPAGDAPWFETGAGPDLDPPDLLPLACEPTEGAVGPTCVEGAGEVATVRLAADEAVRVELVATDGPVRIEAASAGSATAHAIRIEGLTADRSVRLDVAAIDLAANRTGAAGAFDSGTPLPALVLSETYADPVGPEPEQEFIEVVNVGDGAVVLDGLAVADGAGTGEPIAGAPPLPAGAYAILVHPAFVPGGGDPAPAPGAAVVRLAGPIGSNGLLNAGETVSIVDAAGRTVTIAPDLLPPRTGVSIERTDLAADPYDAGSWAHNPSSSATPGAANAARRRGTK